jgi:hypothetical protein
MALDRVRRQRQFEAAISQNRDQLSLLLPLHEDAQEPIPPGASEQFPLPRVKRDPMARHGQISFILPNHEPPEEIPLLPVEIPNPRGRAPARQDFLSTTPFQLIQPFAQADWPLPQRRAEQPNVGFTGSSIYGHPPVFPEQLDNPASKKPPVQGFETTPSLALTFVEELPPPSLDWALPRRRTLTRQDFIQPSVQAEENTSPFVPVEFPNPRRAPRPTQPQHFRLAQEDVPVRPEHIPNPRGRAYPVELRTYLYSNFAVLSDVEEIPVRPQLFPNPVIAKVRPRPGNLRLYDEDYPVRPHEWPVPKGRPFPAHLRSFIYSSLYIIPPPETPLRPFDWPNPKRRVPRGHGSTFHNTPLINQPPETPIRPFDWTNPRVKPYPRIRGFIQFVMPPPQPPIREFNWPVPRGRSQAIRRQPQIPPSYMVIGILPEPGDFGGTVVRLREYEAFVSFPVYSAVVQFPLYSDELRMPEYEESLSFPSYELYSPVNRRR